MSSSLNFLLILGLVGLVAACAPPPPQPAPEPIMEPVVMEKPLGKY